MLYDRVKSSWIWGTLLTRSCACTGLLRMMNVYTYQKVEASRSLLAVCVLGIRFKVIRQHEVKTYHRPLLSILCWVTRSTKCGYFDQSNH
jgi:hypothetical protein